MVPRVRNKAIQLKFENYTLIVSKLNFSMVIKGATITKGQLRAIARVKERQGLDQQKPKKQGHSIRKEEWNDRFFVKEELGSKARRSKSNRRVKRVYDDGKYTRATSPLDMTRIQDTLEKVDQDVDVEIKLKDK